MPRNWTALDYQQAMARIAAGRKQPEKSRDKSREAEQEARLEAEVEAYLSSEQIYFHHDRDRRGDLAGVPDLLICYRGSFVAAELKSRTGKLRPEQAAAMAMIRKSGGRTFVARSLEEFMEKLTSGYSDGMKPQMETANADEWEATLRGVGI